MGEDLIGKRSVDVRAALPAAVITAVIRSH